MMFSAALVLALPLLAVTSPARRDNSTDCATSPIQCCENLVEPSSSYGEALLKQAGLEKHEYAYSGSIAESCNTGIGILDGSTCSGTPVCCSAESGLIGIGCVPVTL